MTPDKNSLIKRMVESLNDNGYHSLAVNTLAPNTGIESTTLLTLLPV
ncbi:MAG: hypothetical protein E6663_14050 [Staphylococcus lugdunensis]|nr:hypothetical protein [Staphylococcus lugdunensis]